MTLFKRTLILSVSSRKRYQLSDDVPKQKQAFITDAVFFSFKQVSQPNIMNWFSRLWGPGNCNNKKAVEIILQPRTVALIHSYTGVH